MFQNFKIKENQKGMLFNDGVFQNILSPGTHSFFDPLKKLEVKVVSTESPLFYAPYLDHIKASHQDIFDEHFFTVVPKENEVVVVLIHNNVYQVHVSGTRAYYWKSTPNIEFEKHTVTGILVEEELLLSLRKRGLQISTNTNLAIHHVPEEHEGLLYVDNTLESKLKPGVYATWKTGQSVEVFIFDKRTNELEINGQEVLTKDKVTIRINLVGFFNIVKPEIVRTKVQDHLSYLYKQMQFQIRQSIEQRTIDEVLSARGDLDKELVDNLKKELNEYGIELKQVSIKDIILPGEMRDIFNKVIQAEKEAQANYIKRREETAATRSLLNTARLMDEHPTLLRLKELEAAENILQKVENLSIYGGVNDLLQGILPQKK